jgi:hypothetical protein
MTQLQLAEILDVNQGEISKIEHRSEICISSLADYVEAVGGRLEIPASLLEPFGGMATSTRCSTRAARSQRRRST